MTDPNVLQTGFAERHGQLGGDEGALGRLVEGPGSCADDAGAFAHYERGSLFRNPHDGGVYAIHGPVRDRWASLGWEASFLGYPTGDAEQAGDVLVAHFERGEIESRPDAEPAVRPAQVGHDEYGGLYEARLFGEWHLELAASGEFAFHGKLYRRDGSGLQISSLLTCAVAVPTGVVFGIARAGQVDKAEPETFGPDDAFSVAGSNERLRELWAGGEPEYADRLYGRDEQGGGGDIPDTGPALEELARQACGKRGFAFTELVVLQPAS